MSDADALQLVAADPRDGCGDGGNGSGRPPGEDVNPHISRLGYENQVSARPDKFSSLPAAGSMIQR